MCDGEANRIPSSITMAVVYNYSHINMILTKIVVFIT